MYLTRRRRAFRRAIDGQLVCAFVAKGSRARHHVCVLENAASSVSSFLVFLCLSLLLLLSLLLFVAARGDLLLYDSLDLPFFFFYCDISFLHLHVFSESSFCVIVFVF